MHIVLLQNMENVTLLTEFAPYLVKKFGFEPREFLDALTQYGFKFYDVMDKGIITHVEVPDLLKRYTIEKKNYTNLLCRK